MAIQISAATLAKVNALRKQEGLSALGAGGTQNVSASLLQVVKPTPTSVPAQKPVTAPKTTIGIAGKPVPIGKINVGNGSSTSTPGKSTVAPSVVVNTPQMPSPQNVTPATAPTFDFKSLSDSLSSLFGSIQTGFANLTKSSSPTSTTPDPSTLGTNQSAPTGPSSPTNPPGQSPDSSAQTPATPNTPSAPGSGILSELQSNAGPIIIGVVIFIVVVLVLKKK